MVTVVAMKILDSVEVLNFVNPFSDSQQPVSPGLPMQDTLCKSKISKHNHKNACSQVFERF